MSNARDKANIPALNFSSTGIDDNATSTAITIDSGENVGINVTNPGSFYSGSNNLVVKDGISIFDTTDSRLEFVDGTSGSEAYVGNIVYNHASNFMRFGVNVAERMRIDSSGNVGIGVVPNTDWNATYYKALQIRNSAVSSYVSGTTFGTAISTNQRTIGNTFVGDNKYIASAAASLYLQDNLGQHSWYTAPSGTANASISWSERMRINSSGNVGIGTSSPSVRFDARIATLTGKVAEFHNSGGFGIGFSVESNGGVNTINSETNQALAFATNGTSNERMRINSSGLVLAGTTTNVNNAHTFKAIADSNLYAALSAEDPTTTVGSIRGIVSYASGSSGGAGTGYLYIGRTNTGDQFYVRSDGDCQNTNNSYGAISDRNLKENEVDASSQWNDIKAIQVKNYNLKSLPERTHLGVIAQDLEASGMNGLVKTDEDGTKSVKYSILYMKAVKALQEAIERIETLEAKVQTLENNQP